MGRSITRRYSLKAIAATAMCAPAVLGSATRGSAAPLPKLPNLSAGEALLLRPADRNYERYQVTFNARTMLRPQLRALCKTAKSVSVMVDWCRTNNLPFALRGGGHSFEGLSESESVVIDTRLMNDVTIEASHRSARVGAGATLGAIYKAVAAHNLAIPAGACLTAGVAGQALGGGTGYLGRAYGLLCDHLQSVELVAPQANIVVADPLLHFRLVAFPGS
jgi:FAD/FMN-containing dehydrogenase